MTDVIAELINNLWVVFREYVNVLTFVLPRTLGIALTLVLGWALGRVLGKVVATVVKLSKADDIIKGTPFGAFLSRAETSLSALMDLATRITIYLITLSIAIRLLGVQEALLVAQELSLIVARIVVGTVVLIVGLLVVSKLFSLASKAVAENDRVARAALGVTHVLMVLIVIAAALSAAGINLSPLEAFVRSMAEGIGLGTGLALVVIALVVFRKDLRDLANWLLEARGSQGSKTQGEDSAEE